MQIYLALLAGRWQVLPVFALLKDWQGSDPTGWLMSEKLDGWRVMWDGAAFITREGNTLDAPEWFTAGLPPVALDGELFAGRGGFNAIQGLMRDGWHGLTFQVFDAPGAGAFRARAAYLKAIELPAHVAIVSQVRCKGVHHLIEFADGVVDAGGEGAVIRDPRSKWQAGRSGDILRWVPQNPALNRR
jgi:DNA ligase-1